MIDKGTGAEAIVFVADGRCALGRGGDEEEFLGCTAPVIKRGAGRAEPLYWWDPLGKGGERGDSVLPAVSVFCFSPFPSYPPSSSP